MILQSVRIMTHESKTFKEIISIATCGLVFFLICSFHCFFACGLVSAPDEIMKVFNVKLHELSCTLYDVCATPKYSTRFSWRSTRGWRSRRRRRACSRATTRRSSSARGTRCRTCSPPARGTAPRASGTWPTRSERSSSGTASTEADRR